MLQELKNVNQFHLIFFENGVLRAYEKDILLLVKGHPFQIRNQCLFLGNN